MPLPSREALTGNPTLLAIIDPLLAAGAALRDQLAILEKRVRDAARQDPSHLARRRLTYLLRRALGDLFLTYPLTCAVEAILGSAPWRHLATPWAIANLFGGSYRR